MVRRLLLAALLATGGLVLLAPAPAAACSCVTADPRELVPQADVVVLGTFVDLDGHGSEQVYTLSVDRVLKGEAPPVAEIHTFGSGGACGLTAELGKPYVVLASAGSAHPEELWSGLCDGTEPAHPGRLAQVEAAAEPYAATAAVRPGAPGAPQEDSAHGWVGGGLVLLVCAAAALVVSRRRAARRARRTGGG